jgi:hypothetical protein
LQALPEDFRLAVYLAESGGSASEGSSVSRTVCRGLIARHGLTRNPDRELADSASAMRRLPASWTDQFGRRS